MIYMIQINTIVIEIAVTFILLIIIIPTYLVSILFIMHLHILEVNGKLHFIIEL